MVEQETINRALEEGYFEDTKWELIATILVEIRQSIDDLNDTLKPDPWAVL